MTAQSALKLTPAQLEAAKHLLAGLDMNIYMDKECYFQSGGSGRRADIPTFSIAVLQGLVKKGVATAVEKTEGVTTGKRHRLNAEKRAEVEALVAAASANPKLPKLSAAQGKIVDLMKKRWVLMGNTYGDGFTLQEPDFRYGRKENRPIPAATVRSLLSLCVVQPSHIWEGRQHYRLNPDKYPGEAPVTDATTALAKASG